MRHARPDYDGRFRDEHPDPARRIPDGEPVFLLRGQDAAAPAAVRAWADEAERIGASPEMVRLAREHVTAMETWSRNKTPDLPGEASPLETLLAECERAPGRAGSNFTTALLRWRNAGCPRG